MINLDKLRAQYQTILHQQDIDGCILVVKETQQYRWFEYGGSFVQSLMDKTQPAQILIPVYQSLLLFLLMKKQPLRVLNLGLGGASIERTLASIPDLSITSVDASQAIIDMAKRYFHLPNKVEVICQKAELFIEQTTAQYDVVLCDVFTGEKSPDFLFEDDFYARLANITANNSTVMINIQAETDSQLFTLLLAIKKHFPYIGLIEFDDYKNIVIVGRTQEIPSRATLQKRLTQFSPVTFTCLDKAIEKMRYIPHG